MMLPDFPAAVSIDIMRAMRLGEVVVYEAEQNIRTTISTNVTRIEGKRFEMRTMILTDPQEAESKKIICLTRME